ncbi:MAG: hypothetical protein WAM39_14775 [Bryobacteraceae bacterium]
MSLPWWAATERIRDRFMLMAQPRSFAPFFLSSLLKLETLLLPESRSHSIRSSQ